MADKLRVIVKSPIYANPLEVYHTDSFTQNVDLIASKILNDAAAVPFQIITVKPEVTPGPGPEPGPAPTPGALLYDSNTDIDWASITDPLKKYTFYGVWKPNGKYIRAKASGNPRFYLDPADKSICLEHDGKYGRLYIGVCNYQSRLECEFKLQSCKHGASWKSRNRHQYADVFKAATPEQRQGGQGTGIRCDSIDADLEVVHGTEMQGPNAKLSPNLVAGQYYKMRFSQFDKGTHETIHIIDELDFNDGKGFVIVNEGDIHPPSQFFNVSEFLAWSEFWLRGNMDTGGKMWFKNVKMYAL